MDVVDHIQPAERPKEKLPLGLIEAGGSCIPAGVQLLRPEGNSCPELWQKAEALFIAARNTTDKKEHHRLVMEAGLAFGDVCLAAGNYPVEKSFALTNIGLIMQAMDQMEAAEKAMALALQLNPTHPTVIQNFATVRMVKGDLKGANEWFYKAIEKDPHCAEARWNSALIALTFGDFRRGFINFEWRWQCGLFTWRKLKTSRPQWKGQDLKGKTILLTHEQGFGDSIMFIRYAKMVKALGAARVRYLCLPELICILKDVEGIDSVTEYQDMNRDGSAGDEDFDYHCPLLSLPRIFKTRVETVPWDGPYIRPFRGFGGLLKLPADKLKVGVVWAGRKEYANDKNRSISLETFAPLLDVPGVNWYSLQVGERSEDAARFPQIYCPPLKSFTDTAWWLNELDLLISVDTAAAHLAGAMARPVWTLLPYSADWRWMMDREDSPWYKTMRLFRQKEKGQWGEVIQRAKDELCKKLAPQST